MSNKNTQSFRTGLIVVHVIHEPEDLVAGYEDAGYEDAVYLDCFAIYIYIIYISLSLLTWL